MRYRVGEIVYVDINENAARRCRVVAVKRLTYLLKAYDLTSNDDRLLIKRFHTSLWRIPKPELLDQTNDNDTKGR